MALKYFSPYFQSTPSVWKGIARLADINGTLDTFYLNQHADQEAIASDWSMVGHDIKKAIRQYESSTQSNKKSDSR